MFYHVSKQDHGQAFKFKPKVPQSALKSKEGNVPRVCVSPTVFHCLRAITSNGKLLVCDLMFELMSKESMMIPLTVYQTNDIPYIPPAVSDFRHNKEHWFIKPVVMERHGFLDLWKLSKGIITVTQSFEPLTLIEFKNSISTDCIKYQKTNYPD